MLSLDVLKQQNEARWKKAKTTRLGFVPVAKRLLTGKDRYQSVSAKTGVPWFIIAVIHEREASQNWASSIAQGDPWNRVSTHVPKGRGPFKSWEDAAYDALVNCPPLAARNRDWSAGGALTLLEQYNGLGYYKRGIPSPYIWAGTDQYKSGKYVADSVFDPTVVDQQLGCAGLLLAIAQLDDSVRFSDDAAPLPPPPDIPAPKPTTTQPAKPGFFVAFIKALAEIFKRK